MAVSRRRHLFLVHGLVILACSVPAVRLAFASWQTFAGATPPPLGANPVETLEHETGLWALRFLVLTLAVTPLRRLGWGRLAPYRRTLGLAAFSYAALHFGVFVGLDLGFDFAASRRTSANDPTSALDSQPSAFSWRLRSHRRDPR